MCLSPRRIRQPNGAVMSVPCLHCSQCLKAYQDQWIARLNEEVKAWKPVLQDGKMLPPVVFFTLKFRNDSIPCSYLCVSRHGWYVTDVRPDCRVLEFWTDTVRETREQWQARRIDILREYASMYSLCCSLQDRERQATPEEIEAGHFHTALTANPYYLGPSSSYVDPDTGEVYIRQAEPEKIYQPLYVADLPLAPEEVEFFSHDGSQIRHPRFGRTLNALPPDQIPVADPILALEFHTVRKDIVSAWFKRCRRLFEYRYGKRGKERMYQTWMDSEGIERPLPSAALTDTFKYFVTSEYGSLTHRPHMHGALFGITYAEFAEIFAPDWEDRYGSVNFSVLRSSGGAMTYLSKYCSKGSYEHPYCCRDFIYPSGREYHSEHYSHCIDDFNVDVPLVSPTFHLISKGIGSRYVYQPAILHQFGVQIADYVTRKGMLAYSASDAPDSLAANLVPSLPLDRLMLVTSDLESLSENLRVDLDDDGSIHLRKYLDGRFVSESFIRPEAVVDTVVEELILNQKYNRSYVSIKDSRTATRGLSLPRWHFIGLPGIGSAKIKTTSISLPRYYRRWLVSPLASALRSAAAIRLHPDVDASIFDALRSLGPEDSSPAWVVSELAGREMRELDSSRRLRLRAANDYCPAHVHDLD